VDNPPTKRKDTMSIPRLNKQSFIEHLNELPIPAEDLKSNVGRIPDQWEGRYGEWMRLNDPIAFNVGFQEWKREEEFRAERR
jgi:hypothetical protein